MKKILKLHDFGSFKAFETPDLPDFAKYNLFFAYNGTGKTTFSRFLHFLSKENSLPKEFKDEGYKENFKIELENGNTIETFEEYDKTIKVFNSDFIAREIDFSENKLSAISVDFGKGQKYIKNRIKRLNILANKLFETNSRGEKTEKIIYSKELQENETELDNLYKNQANKIREELELDSNSYKNLHFKNDIKNYDDATQIITLTEKENSKILFKQKNTNPINYKVQNDVILTEEELRDINALLKKTIRRKNSSLKEDIIEWIENGKNIHTKENAQRCLFCNNLLINWEQRLAEINEIILKDDEYEAFDIQFNEIYKTVVDKFEKFKTINFMSNNNSSEISDLEFLEIHRERAKSIKEDISLYKELCQNYLSQIIEILKTKKADYSITEFEELKYDAINNLKEKITAFKKLIEENNLNISALEASRKTAKIIVINYHIQQSKKMRDMLQNNIEAYTQKVKKADKISQKIFIKIQQYNNQLENQSAAIDKIEQYLTNIFTFKKFKFNYDEETQNYKITREDGKNAKNLSEGEKTVIAFSYFLTTLEDKSFALKNSIVVIDDPISSLDQNYLYNLLTLLTKRFNAPSKFQKLFVLTHNFYFFKKLRDILKHIANNNLQIYQIIKNKETSKIITATEHYLNYQSEYLAKIENLKNWYSEENLEESIEIGVAIRKVFEIFLSYQAPYETSIYRKFGKVFNAATMKYRYLEGIANACCHTDEIDDLDTLEPYKLSVGKEEIKQLFAFIREIDEQHSSALNLPEVQ